MDDTRFIVGTSGWSYDHWKGQFYPQKLPKSRWLDFYASKFSSVEINATFYGWFKDQTYLKWRDETPACFSFVLKAPRLITHGRHLIDVDEPIGTFSTSAGLLGQKFGLVLLQIAPDTPYDPGRLQRALAAFRDPAKVAVEFRNSAWEVPETLNILEKSGAVFCNPDSPARRLQGILTSETGYIRLHGRNHWYAYDYPENELEEIASTVNDMIKRGAKTVYVFFNNDYGGYAPKNAKALAQIAKKITHKE